MIDVGGADVLMRSVLARSDDMSLRLVLARGGKSSDETTCAGS